MTKDLEKRCGQKARGTDDYAEDPNAPAIGRWYMVKMPECQPWLGCVVHIGSNYAEVEGIHGSNRIHFDHFDEQCTAVDDPEAIINGHITAHQTQVRELMAEVKRITLQLGVAPDRPQGDTQAIAMRGQGDEIASYKSALILAKEEKLPKLFEAIKEENKQMGRWLKAKLIPLEAESAALEPAMSLIKDRIFSVELYAGLCETVVQVKGGKPADIGEPIHLYQRRAYMDEECLANYEAGGMEFKDMPDFHKWLARKENLNRILPQPRCLIAFRVRRHSKEREVHSLSMFWRMLNLEQADKFTYLYIRNGEQLFCLATQIDFDEQLFPDLERSKLDGKLYAKMSGSRVQKLITEGHYLDLLKEERETERERKKNLAAAAPKDKWLFEHRGSFSSVKDDYRLFVQEDVYFDDMAAYVKEQMDRHNRLVLVLQGLLDRSPVLHPHPPYQLWKPDDFSNALRLIYDSARALTTGDKPDFERYRAGLNATLKKGSVTVGQEHAWMRHEAIKENAREENRYRSHDRYYEHTLYRPHGDPGMGHLAKVDKAVQTIGGIKLTYNWIAKSQKRRWEPCIDKPGYRRMVHYDVDRSFTCDEERVLNVDAYTPGDFKIFFNDPRTREEYLEWAPLLLVAEDYKAGKRKLGKKEDDE